MSYVVFATVPVKPEFFDEACAAVDGIVVQTRGEDGCLSFKPYRATGEATDLMIYEEWADRPAFDFHHAQPYTREVYAKYENWLAAEPRIVEVKGLKD